MDFLLAFFGFCLVVRLPMVDSVAVAVIALMIGGEVVDEVQWKM